jgi:hypothetical protein
MSQPIKTVADLRALLAGYPDSTPLVCLFDEAHGADAFVIEAATHKKVSITRDEAGKAGVNFSQGSTETLVIYLAKE